jgi:hypothetical protein
MQIDSCVELAEVDLQVGRLFWALVRDPRFKEIIDILLSMRNRMDKEFPPATPEEVALNRYNANIAFLIALEVDPRYKRLVYLVNIPEERCYNS